MRRKRGLTKLLPALLAAPALASAQTPTVEQRLADLRRTPPLTEVFHEISFRKALRAPLVSAGRLHWHGGMAFMREVDAPYRETSRLRDDTLVVTRDNGRERIIPLARAPELGVLFGAQAALFAGDQAGIERDFEIDYTPGPRWRLRLLPREPRLRARVSALELRGGSDGPDCLILDQEGAQTLTVLGERDPPSPAADFDSTVASLCPLP